MNKDLSQPDENPPPKKKRRGHNEGTIYRSNGGWRAAVTIPGTGKRRYFYGKTKKEVQEKANAFRLKLSQGITGIDSREPLGELLHRWLDEVAEVKLRPKTVEDYRSSTRRHIIPDIGHIPLNKLTPVVIQSWVSTRRRAGASPFSIRNALAVLRRCLRSAVSWQLIAMNPAVGIEIPPLPRREYRTLTPKEYRKLLSATAGSQLQIIFLVELYTGLRKGELLGLRWQDVLWDSRAILVQGALQRTRGSFGRTEVKTPSSKRGIAVPESLLVVLREHWERTEYLRLPDEDTGQVLLFMTPKGTPMDPRNFNAHVTAALKEAGLPHIRVHDLRHTFATLQLEAGVHPRIVSERLGHTRFSTTMDIYTHVSLDAQRGAAEKLNQMVEGDPPKEEPDEASDE